MGDRIDDVYFPFNALVSFVKGMADGKVVEVGLVGSDRMTGVAGLLGGGASSRTCDRADSKPDGIHGLRCN